MYYKVTVVPNSKREMVIKKTDDSYELFVREPKERGEANKRLVVLLGNLHPKQSIKIIKGHHHEKKIIEIV